MKFEHHRIVARVEELLWWAEIIRNRHAVVSMDCLYAIVVLEWDTSMECSFTLLDTTVSVIEKSLYPAKT